MKSKTFSSKAVDVKQDDRGFGFEPWVLELQEKESISLSATARHELQAGKKVGAHFTRKTELSILE